MSARIFRLQFAGMMVVILVAAACSPSPAAVAPEIPTATPRPIQALPTTPPLPTQPPRTPVIIDTDMSVDAIMAILYLLQRPEFSVKAITVAGDGEAHCGPGSEHALGLVAIVGAGDIPVACGRETPLTGDHQFPSQFRATVDSTLRINWPRIGQASKLTAVELIQKTISASTSPVVILTDGPLTNVGEALENDPSLVKNIQMIYIMGGAVEVPGNLYGVPLEEPNTAAEFNIYIDPHAANLVIQSGAQVTLVPLDVTNQVPLDGVFFKLLTAHQTTPAAKAVYDMLDYTGSYQASGMYLWDPLTYAIASDNSLASYVTKKISVVEEEGPENGRTKASEAGTEIRIAMTTNYERFMETYLSALNGGEKLAIDWAAALATPKSAANLVTVTTQDGVCTLAGLTQVPAGMVDVKLIDRDIAKDAGLAIVTLDEGKTLADVEAWPSTDPPPWIQLLGFIEVNPGKELTQNFELKDKPLYFFCFDKPPERKIGGLGPIEAVK
ncbi:MAG: nucleoside hydrolase [Chloroflexi bacterium]|nr:nucleoside hydrolase [Chloroflexota bacterium]